MSSGILQAGVVFVVSAALTGSARADPAVDGVISTREWYGSPQATTIQFRDGWISTRLSSGQLFLLVDLTSDTNDDGACDDDREGGEWLSVVFDTDGNGKLGIIADTVYRVQCGSKGQIVGYTCIACRPSDVRLHQRTGARLAAGFGPSDRASTAHRIWEIAIPVAELGRAPAITAWVLYGSQTPRLRGAFPEDERLTIALRGSAPRGPGARPQPRADDARSLEEKKAEATAIRVLPNGTLEITLSSGTKRLLHSQRHARPSRTAGDASRSGSRRHSRAGEGIDSSRLPIQTPRNDLPMPVETKRWLTKHAEQLMAALTVMFKYNSKLLDSYKELEKRQGYTLEERVDTRTRLILELSMIQ